ncbi:MAG: hypothetical protein QNJ46_16445 [Leptolyngbyaceae cyanobacterium MO_188.B28]|nr:hypothetical protein [Leptolyngbyaceae cyanobacterium MO_188.B28]
MKFNDSASPGVWGLGRISTAAPDGVDLVKEAAAVAIAREDAKASFDCIILLNVGWYLRYSLS